MVMILVLLLEENVLIPRKYICLWIEWFFRLVGVPEGLPQCHRLPSLVSPG